MTEMNNYPLIRAKAKELITRFGITELPVDPFEIAHKFDIQTYPKPSNQKGGISGALVRSGNNFGILYATNIPNIGYQRFTVAHEIGHYVLDYPRKNSPLPGSSLTYEINRNQAPLREDEADTNIDDWFESDFDLEGKEEVIHLGDYEKTLTLLTFYGDYEDVSEEENMVASWEPKFR